MPKLGQFFEAWVKFRKSLWRYFRAIFLRLWGFWRHRASHGMSAFESLFQGTTLLRSGRFFEAVELNSNMLKIVDWVARRVSSKIIFCNDAVALQSVGFCLSRLIFSWFIVIVLCVCLLAFVMLGIAYLFFLVCKTVDSRFLNVKLLLDSWM